MRTRTIKNLRDHKQERENMWAANVNRILYKPIKVPGMPKNDPFAVRTLAEADEVAAYYAAYKNGRLIMTLPREEEALEIQKMYAEMLCEACGRNFNDMLKLYGYEELPF